MRIKRFTALFVLLLLLISTGWAQVPRVSSRFENGGYLRYFDRYTGETVEIVGPSKLFENFTAGTNAGATATFQLDFSTNSTASTPSAIAITASTGGIARITLGATDNDDGELATELIWNAQKFCSAEARIKLGTTVAGLNFGFSDAKAEAADYLALQYSGTILSSSATNCALFFYDSDATTDNFYAVSVGADTDGTVVNSGTAGDTSYHIFRVDIDSAGNVDYWLDGDHIGSESAGIATNVRLCGYLGFIRRDGAAGNVTADIDYFRVWQSR